MKKLPILTLLCVAALSAGLYGLRMHWGLDFLASKVRANDAQADAVSVEESPEKTEKQPETAIAVATQAEATQPETEQKPSALPFIQALRKRLMNPTSPYSVKMLQFARVNDRREVIRSQYSQSGMLKSRLSVEMSFLGIHARLLQVSDGERLWTERQMVPRKQENPTETPVSVKPWLEVRRRQLSSLKRIVEENQLSLESPEVCQMICGGVPAMMASMERMFQWTQSGNTSINQRPATVFEGTWEASSLLSLEPKSPHQLMMFEHFRPDVVELSVDHQTGLPVRIVYYERNKEQKPARSPVFAIEFQEWQFGQLEESETFQYRIPNGVVPVDETHECMVHLKP